MSQPLTRSTQNLAPTFIEGYWRSIPGWFDYQDIYDVAVEEAKDGAHFVEIGCWLGRSTCYLAEAVAKSSKNISITVVDTFCGVPDDELQLLLGRHGGSVDEAFRTNMNRSGLSTLVDVIVEDSKIAHGRFAEGSLDFVFIDGDHSYEGVRQDITNWLPKVRRGGTLAGHDYGNSESVRRAVDELLGPCPASVASWMFRPDS
jgi:hypothetical protein